MDETVKEPVTSQETATNPEQVIEKVTSQTSFPAVRKRSEAQEAWSKQLGKQSQMFKQQKKERLIQQELQDQQQSKSDIATIEELIKDEEPVKQDQTAIYIGLGLVAIIGFGAYSLYSRKAQSLTAKAVKTVKSGIVNME